MSWLPYAAIFISILAFVYEYYTGSIRSGFYKPVLKFDVRECLHWIDLENNQSGINLNIFIRNIGKKATTIRDIRLCKIEPEEYYWSAFNIHFKPIRVDPNSDILFRETYFFKKLLDTEKLSLVFEVEDTYGTESFSTQSYLITRPHDNGNTPNITIEYANDFRSDSSEKVVTYYLMAKNIGEVIAENVEIRLNKVEQKKEIFQIRDRYVIGRFDYINVGDGLSFSFISDYKGREGVDDQLRTPAGQDIKFPRENGIFTFIISGKNFPLSIQKIKMVWNESLKKYDLIKI